VTLLVATGGLRAAVNSAAQRLAAAGVPSPRFDAEELAAHALGVDRRELWSLPSLGAAAGAFEAYVVRRAAR
jgi:release factor glutamine methyltransferase